ncbi:MAG: 2-dehydropantoate 2-reductase [Smithellaceae bacterium]|nr:2-dehydropantoate 2-reductase [Syntrophaceae bacterium]MDD4240089.1 2-dehydropantoate 2-reductase [Smithellaceae bacterium]NLX51453.1 2-dehydropantoate 2-reductase [Deltaproteobacteria bacterium]
MRIAIVGIGGVGGYFGGKLAGRYASSGMHEIIFIARGEHLRKIQKNGLQLYTREGVYIAWPNVATDDPSEHGIFDLVFFCVKSYSLEDAARRLKENISRRTVVIPLLNGVDSALRLSAVLPEADIVSGSVYIITFIEKPGVVIQTQGACRLTFGTDDPQTVSRYTPILQLLVESGIDAHLSDHITDILWKKYLMMCPLGSLTAATGQTYGRILQDEDLRNRLAGLMREVTAVAKALHIRLPADAVEKTMDMIGRFSFDAKTSMQLDRERGNKTEVDTLTAYLCRKGRETGIPTPLHDEVLRQLDE